MTCMASSVALVWIVGRHVTVRHLVSICHGIHASCNVDPKGVTVMKLLIALRNIIESVYNVSNAIAMCHLP